MFKLAYAYYLLFSRGLIFRLAEREQDDFWAWLYLRISNPKSVDFQNEIFAKWLFVDALEDDEHYRVARIFKDYQSMIEPKLSPENRDKVVYSLYVSEVQSKSDYKPLPTFNDS